METSQIGVRVTEGPSSWTVLQQTGGYADLSLRGDWNVNGDYDPDLVKAYVRIVNEEDGQAVLPWQPCGMHEKQHWSVRLSVPAGGLYRAETCLRIRKDDPAMEWPLRGDMIHHLGVGDLWIIAGQSNAAGYGKGPYDDQPELGVHMLRHNGHWDMATHPLNESTGTLHPPNREWSNPGHSPFLVFGKRLKQATGYPIGLIQTALGGSHLRSWNPEEEGELYRNMKQIVEQAGRKIKGILWYQGCSDANMPETDESVTYLRRFRTVVDHWREDFGLDTLPVLTVQLNRLIGWEVSDALDRCWGRVREAQKQAAEEIPGVYVVPALDSPLSDNIHNSPAGNLKIGERLARVALSAVYGSHLPYRAPRAVKALSRVNPETEVSEIVLQFADVAGFLLTHTKEDVFTVEDAAGRIGVMEWHIIADHEVLLTLSRHPQEGAAVHGAFETNPAYYVPFDNATQWPMLAFYGLPVDPSDC
ncbi:sialate O-acetylesterase [Paenibacillus nasutitermitis]|uniref:Sialate O-acetylesterase domain-containing protein n=1 Tax=Paenibacillus nasutitermitis TaxID=1652958 RepID=A0A917DZD4_9BACL|nr:sialate O-acetylesterase [Paenibacillus nasutitermitis]GGD83091.1 hypothetical protein GCM10010911_46620 [Paenibacillus nasutitermitis]